MRKLLALLALIPSTAFAANLGEIMQGEAKYTFHSTKPLADVERCIVLSDMPDWANVYRAPEKPNESLIYYHMGSTIQLEANSRGTTIRLWRPIGKGMAQNLERCAG